MYTTSQRSSHNMWQRTSSWRTGRRVEPDEPREVVPSNPPVRRTGENLGAFLNRRNQYYKTIAANLQSQPSYNGHVLVSDGGHTFHTVHVTRSPGRYTQYYPNWATGPRRTGQCVPYVHLLKQDYDFIAFDLSASKPGISKQAFMWPVVHKESGTINNVISQQVNNAVTNTVPDQSQYGWGETIVELLRGNFPRLVPDLIKRAKIGATLDPKATGKSLGSDYLNARFGIEPIVKDFLAVLSNLNAVHENLYDTYKRSRSTEKINDVMSLDRTLCFFDTGGSGEVQRLSGTATMSTDSWLRAKYAKVAPSGAADSFYARSQSILRNLGFNERLTWDLIPWSWLIDWSGNIGNSIESAAAFNLYNGRFATTYSWVTRRTVYSSSVGNFDQTSGSGLNAIRTFGSGGWCSVITKQRHQVSPFGPNFTMPSLSPYQWSILVSLGLAKLK